MLQCLFLAQFFGVLPLFLRKGRFYESQWMARYSLFTAAWLFLSAIGNILTSIPCLDSFYISVDTFIFTGLPFNIAVLWILRKPLCHTLWISFSLLREANFIPTWNTRNSLNSSIFVVQTLSLFCGVFFIINSFLLECPYYSSFAFFFSQCYLWLIDMVFFVLYHYNKEILNCLLQTQKFELETGKGSSLVCLKKLKEKSAAALLNLKDTHCIFSVYGFFLALNCFVQLVAFSDYVFGVFSLYTFIHGLCAVGFHFLRLAYVCRLTAQPAKYVSFFLKVFRVFLSSELLLSRWLS